MGTPFLSEIRIMSFNFAPKGWAMCNGQFLPIAQNQALFSLLGTVYGGNGTTTFVLPDLRGRTSIHMGNGYTQGEILGQEFHTVTPSEMPGHNHQVNAATTVATNNVPDPSRILAQSTAANLYAPASNFRAMAAASVANSGGSQPHENRQPFLVLNFCIALQGIFPSRN